MDKAALQQFTTAIRQAYSDQIEPIADQADFDRKYRARWTKPYDTATRIGTSAGDPQLLQALMKSYLALYAKYQGSPNNVHYYRSDQVFYELVDRSARNTDRSREPFESWKRAIKAPTPATGPDLKKRFDDLSKTYQSQVGKSLSKVLDKPSTPTRVLDILVEEFRRSSGRDPTDADLYAFDPVGDPKLRQAFSGRLQALQTLWNQWRKDNSAQNHDFFFGALDEYIIDFLADISKTTVLPIFQVLRWMQDSMRPVPVEVRKGKERIDPNLDPLLYELYTLTCLRLVGRGQALWALPANRQGLTSEERDYLLAPVLNSHYPYWSNIGLSLRSDLADIRKDVEISKVFLSMIVLQTTEASKPVLLPAKETMALQEMWTSFADVTDVLRGASGPGMAGAVNSPATQDALKKLAKVLETEVELGRQGPELGHGWARAGSSPGIHPAFGRLTIIYIATVDTFYVEWEALKPNLFAVSAVYIQQELYRSRIGEIARATAGTIVISQFYFLAMGFTFPLVDAGFAGLIREIAIYYASTLAEEQAAKINPIFGKVVGLATMLLAPRPRGPKLVIPEEVGNQTLVLYADAVETRTLPEVLETQKKEADLIAEVNRGTLRGTLQAASSKIAGKLFDLEMRLRGAFDNAVEKFSELDAAYGQEAAAPAGQGGMLRVRGARGAQGAGTAGRAEQLTQVASRAEQRIRNSSKFKLLDQYAPLLDTASQNELRTRIGAVFENMRLGKLLPSDAQGKITALLNGAKEATGEYVADGVVNSNFDVVEVLSVPKRGENGAPMLDRVYQIRNRHTRQIEYLVVEVKGGTRTRLGFVTRKTYLFKNNSLIIRDTGEWVRQASGEWYYQKIIEIYEAGRNLMKSGDASGRMYIDLARKIFRAAKAGDLQSVIIKSGIEMAPYHTFNTADVMAYFKNIKLPYD